MADNKMASKEAGKALAEALTANSTLKELDVSSNTWTERGRPKGDGPGFAQELAIGVAASRALTSLNISANHIGQLVLPAGWTIDQNGYNSWHGKDKWIYKHTDGREQKGLHPGKPEGVIALANAIKNNGALVTVTVNKFALPVQDIETKKAELDLSCKDLRVEDAIIIAALIPLNVSST